MTTPARPGSFTGATDNAASGGLFTDTLIDGIPDIVGADVARAETAATNAETSATGAATSATNAATSETNAGASATSASTSATNAATSATNAATSASTTAADAATATVKASEAATSATNAASSETAAAGSATSASSSATSATSSANTAVTSASAAGTSETNAATSATNSANSATASANSASASASSATASANSATASQTAQTAAELAETNAETAETNAETAETGAATSATNAANSASAASTSETNAATSATNSANSATASATSATASANSATAAAASEAAAAGYVDNFDDKYLGAKTSDPTVDNDGDPLTDGALYYNTTDNRMKVYDLGTTTWLFLAPTNAEQTNINTVANDITNVNTVATNTSNINAVAADATDIGVVATNISNVNTVATNNANVNTVATNITDVNSFADTYFISATAPASPTTGDLWFDTTNSIMKVYDGSGFVNAGSSVNGTSARYNYTATAGQTTFAAVYDTGYVDVYLNGVKLAPADFTATNGSSIVLTSGAALNDTVDIVGYGTFSVASAIALPDNVKATFGDSADLQIYHDGSDSWISDAAGLGNLYIRSNDLIIMNAPNNETLLRASQDGAVTAYYNGSPKLATTNTGIDVTGVIEFGDSHTIGDDGNDNLAINSSAGENIILGPAGGVVNLADDKKLTFGTGQDLQVYHDGFHSYVSDAGTGNLQLSTNGTAIKMLRGNGEVLGSFNIGGSVDLYHSNAKKFETTASGISVTGANINFASSENGILNVFSNDATAVNKGGSISLGGNSESGALGFAMIKGAKESTDAGYLAFGTRSAAANSTERLRILSNGNVGIGTASADSLLELYKAGTSELMIGSDNAGTAQLSFYEGNSSTKEGFLKYDGANNNVVLGTSGAANALVVARDTGNLALNSVGSGDIAIFKTTANSGTGLYINSQTTNQIDLVGYDGSAANAVNIRAGGATGSGLTMDTSGNATFSGSVTATGGFVGAGGLLQVVQTRTESEKSTTSTSFVASGIFVDITPSSTSSKVLVTTGFTMGASPNGPPEYKLYRSGTALTNARMSFQADANWNATTDRGTIEVLDSPNSTASRRYEIYFKRNGTGAARIGRSGDKSHATTSTYITAMEIAG